MTARSATRTWWLLSPALVSLAAGCAGWMQRLDPEKVRLERERYGATADQRIEELAAESGRARSAPGAEQIEFSRRLTASMLSEHDPRVRSAILATAAEFDTPAAIAICRGGLEDPDKRVRMAACEAWRKRGGPEAVDMLAGRARSDADIDVRLKALRELGELGNAMAVPALAASLEDPDPAVQYRAVASLKQVSGRDLGDDVNAWRAWAADPDAEGTQWSIAEGFRKLF